jgi:hypothetical protein
MTEFEFDVFVSYSSMDSGPVTQLANLLKGDGLRVWFDKWEIRPGDAIPLKIQEGLSKSRILVLAMSRSAFRSDWSTLEGNTFLFRDPLNHERRFIPLLLEDAEIPDTLRQFRYVDWRERSPSEYHDLLVSCQHTERKGPKFLNNNAIGTWDRILNRPVTAMWVDGDGKQILVANADAADVCVVDVESKRIRANISRNAGPACAVAVTPNGKIAVTGGTDGVVRFWDLAALWMREYAHRHGDRKRDRRSRRWSVCGLWGK